MSQPSQLPLRAVVLLVAVSAPLALGFETAIRKLVFVPMMGPQLEELREFYWPQWTPEAREAALTRAAWVHVGVCVLAGVLEQWRIVPIATSHDPNILFFCQIVVH